MDNKHIADISERRSGSERRETTLDYDFPFIDGHGQLVTEDRRKYSRRIEERLQDNINVNDSPVISTILG